MKYAKSAALLAGSVVALGVAAPAVAATPDSSQRFSLNGGIADGLDRGLNNKVTQRQLDGHQLTPLTDRVVEGAETVKSGAAGAVDGVRETAEGGLDSPPRLLGGLPIG